MFRTPDGAGSNTPETRIIIPSCLKQFDRPQVEQFGVAIGEHTGPIHLKVRLISARPATRAERKQHENEPR